MSDSEVEDLFATSHSPLTEHVLPPVLSNSAQSMSDSKVEALLGTRHSPLATSSSNASAPLAYFNALLAAHGPQHWWPGRTRFEIIVGAILTQNASWTNVERAIQNLRAARVLSPKAIRQIQSAKLARLLRPSGYFRQKTRTLKSFVSFLYAIHGGSLNKLFSTPTAILRDQLLDLHGIGPETADSILLYAGKHPVFVVDAYSRRILERHGLSQSKASYEDIRKLFESSLSSDHQLFNEFHALIVHTGKHFCRKSNPQCARCPLQQFLPSLLEPVTVSDLSRSSQSQVTSTRATRHSPLATSTL